MARIHKDLSESSHNLSPTSGASCGSSHSRYHRPANQSPNVAIIGAGIAGLRCADILIQGGAQVTIYEAQNEIGGRTRQTTVDGRLLDLGANFIHGTDDNPIADIAHRTGTAIYPLTGAVIIDSEGNKLDSTLAEELKRGLGKLEAKAFQYSSQNFDEIDQSLNLLDYVKEQIPSIEPDTKKQALLVDLAYSWGHYTGENIEQQSLKFMWLEETISGETPFVADSYAKILADIAAPAQANAKILLNEEVAVIDTHIDSSGCKTEVGVTVITRNGTVEIFDEVILTAPLGWLKKNKANVFSTPLPAEIISSIDNISFSRLEKVYLTFSEAWWEDTPSPSNPFPTPYATTTHFLNPSYAPHPQGIPWNQSMLNLAALRPSPDQSRTPTLLFYLYGDCSAHFLSLFPSIDSSEAVTPTNEVYHPILAFFRPFLSLLPHYSPSSPASSTTTSNTSTASICHPLSILATSYGTSPHTYGSYIHFSPNTGTHLHADIETLREGIGHDSGLWFAGEHTAPFIAVGTTTGAYWSGEEVAKRVLREYGIKLEGKDGNADGVNETE